MKSSLAFAAAGAQVTVAVLGHRNDRLPFFMSQTLGGGHDLTAPDSAATDMSRNQTRWQLSARVQKTITRTAGGETIGLVGDLFVPIGSEIAAVGAPDAPVVRSAAVRFGVVLGF